MKKTFSTMAAAAVLMASTAIAPAMAQTSDPAAPASPAAPADPAMKPMTGTDGAPAAGASSTDNAAAPETDTSTDTAATPATPGADASTDTAATPETDATTDTAATPSTDASTDTAAASGSYLTEQSETQISANDYIGKSVYNAEDESVGDINDLILEKDGGIVAAVIGVGGFLGIGEKDVAVPMENISMTRDMENNNEIRLTTTETKDSLNAAPEFMTLEDQQAAADAATTDTTTTSSTGAATPMPNATTPPTAEGNN
ncbi:PRC-barrel domain-containing protein [Pseudorhizobium flavum]|jgi:sporulation protein YlmC with PRC-barrel domain|uniref:PRC-barrel domain-containing protein n=1 Tax=Pseudorhizobium flavum TaxID=1335061 RepID=UPI00248F8AB6|nr:PRC-barrel domain-containing protein [Pseudorhizobium flavum]